MHGIHTETFDIQDPETVGRIIQQNMNIHGLENSRLTWLNGAKPKKSEASVIVEALDPGMANIAIDKVSFGTQSALQWKGTTPLTVFESASSVRHIATSGLSATLERNAAGVLAHIILAPILMQRTNQHVDAATAVACMQLGARAAK